MRKIFLLTNSSPQLNLTLHRFSYYFFQDFNSKCFDETSFATVYRKLDVPMRKLIEKFFKIKFLIFWLVIDSMYAVMYFIQLQRHLFYNGQRKGILNWNCHLMAGNVTICAINNIHEYWMKHAHWKKPFTRFN